MARIISPTPLLLLACITTAAACRTSPRAEDVCLGERVLAVRNETGESVDVYQVDGGLYRIVATVGPGRTELPLPPADQRRGYYQGRSTKDGRPLTRAHRRAASTDRLTIQVECDTPRP